MSRTYRVTGINLKVAPMGENDRLVTVLTKEHGLIRVIAPGARKHRSKLGGRSGLFVINELMISRGKSIDKMIQAETQQSFPGLSTDLSRLTASQYLAELVLCEAMTDHPQVTLFELLVGHLERLEQAPKSVVLICLAQATFHVLALAGIAPELYQCCITRRPLPPIINAPQWKVGFSLTAGGIVALSELERLRQEDARRPQARGIGGKLTLNTQISALELALMQQLGKSEPSEDSALSPYFEGESYSQGQLWLKIERLLRHYAQYHFDRPIRSAALIDTCFNLPAYAS